MIFVSRPIDASHSAFDAGIKWLPFPKKNYAFYTLIHFCMGWRAAVL